MHRDIARDVRPPRRKARIMLPPRLKLRPDLRRVPEHPNLPPRPNREPLAIHGEAHCFFECAQQRGDAAVIFSHHNKLAGLIGRSKQ